MQLLLNIKHLWWDKPNDQKRPILVICYTNHALEYCITECGINAGVVRVGGRSQSEKLNPFMLSNIKSTIRHNRQSDRNIRYRILEEKNKLNELEKEINKINCLLQIASFTCLLTFQVLKDYCDLEHYLQLFGRNNVLKTNRCGRTPDDFTLLEWLGILNLDPNRNNVVDDPIHSLNIAFEQMSSNDLNDDLIDVDSLNE